MSNYQFTRRTRAKGTLSLLGTERRIAVGFDLSTFNKIAAEADRKHISFAEQVRIYVGLGMDRARKTP
jgi:hypothetical protein